jgi:hypothetical protein
MDGHVRAELPADAALDAIAVVDDRPDVAPGPGLVVEHGPERHGHQGNILLRLKNDLFVCFLISHDGPFEEDQSLLLLYIISEFGHPFIPFRSLHFFRLNSV